MFKKLLYLYNDGHNPFPTGRGGLGYHLPQYPKVIHGEGLSDEKSDEKTDEEIIENADPTTPEGTKIIFEQMIKELKNKEIKKVDTTGLKEIPEIIEKVQSILKEPEPKPEPKNESGVNMDDLNETIEDRINEYEKAYKVNLNSEDKELIRQKLKDDFMDYIKNQKYKNIDINLSEVKNAIKHFEINETPYKQILNEIIQKPKEEQNEFLNDNYDKMYQYYKSNQKGPGKGYETFLCEGIGTNIIKSFVNDDDIEILNFDKSNDIPKDKKDLCVVDMFYKNPKTNKGGIGELKDYNDKDMEEYDNPESNYVAVQASKLCGNIDFDIIFGNENDKFDENGNKIINDKFDENGNKIINTKNKKGKYYIQDVRYKDKSIINDTNIDEYLVSVNAKKNTWISDLMKQKGFIKKYINDDTMTENTKKPGLYVVDIDKIPKSTDKVSGSKDSVQSIRIKNKYFKPQIKKK